ncbi:MAG: hypothetical protein A3G97_00630 [Candidatus Rokubacteria bacterium RIFCSPLOWO2_12_FULL_69_21]|nr:MAG: hypothetical protein A3G97_00630 [Candidatus Rokubacteria bacterium RIFCSPLOWO2_12_FULL_69_21]
MLLAGLGLLGLLTVAAAPEAPRPATRPVVFVARIEGVIDLGLAPYVERVLDEAATAGAAGRWGVSLAGLAFVVRHHRGPGVTADFPMVPIVIAAPRRRRS